MKQLVLAANPTPVLAAESNTSVYPSRRGFIKVVGIFAVALAIVPKLALASTSGSAPLRDHDAARGGRPIIGAVTAEPDHVFINIPVTVTVTCEIADGRLLPGTVTLRSLDDRGKPFGDPVLMTRDADDPNFYNAPVNLLLDEPKTLRFRVSALFVGSASRTYSKVIDLPVTSIQPSEWREFRSASGYGFNYPASWRVSESEKAVLVFCHGQQPKSPAGLAPSIAIEYESNEEGLTAEEFFNGERGPDLFAGALQISEVNVDGVTSTQAVGLEAIPYGKVVVIPFARAFLVIYSNAPDEVFGLFLTTVSLQGKEEVQQ